MKLNENLIFTAFDDGGFDRWSLGTNRDSLERCSRKSTCGVSASPPPPVTAADIQELKAALAAQQQQIQALQAELQSKNQTSQPQVQSAGLSVVPVCRHSTGRPRLHRTQP